MVKFSDMPYERADLEAAGRELKALAKALCDAKSGEEQFEIHQKYYALKSRTETMVTLAQIRHDIDVTDEFYDQEQEYYDREIPVMKIMLISIRRHFMRRLSDHLWREKSVKLLLKIWSLRSKALMRVSSGCDRKNWRCVQNI